jgi:predicted RNA-binding protein with PUA-like domain
MNYWIGIVGSKITMERFLKEDSNWFCMPKSCDIGDQVLMYASKKAAGAKSGVFGAYEIRTKDEAKDGECRRYGIFSGSGERPIYIDLKLIKKFTSPLTFQSIKSNKFLANFPYVRRNFQATYFKISEKEYETFLKLENLNE